MAQKIRLLVSKSLGSFGNRETDVVLKVLGPPRKTKVLGAFAMIHEDNLNEVASLTSEKIKAYFVMLYSGQISAAKVHELLQISFDSGAILSPRFFFHSNTAWMHGGHRDFHGGKLCYDCAEELMGPGCGKVNDLRSYQTRRSFCDWCGEGAFNMNGERVSEAILIIASS